MKNSFFEVRNQTEDKAEIFIIGQIKSEKPWYEEGEESKDNYLRDFIKTMKDLKGVKSLDIHINSPGGALFAGMTMYNLLKQHNSYKKVYIDGSAASAAGIVALAGDEVIIPKNAFLMMHKPILMASGNANDLMKVINTLNTIEEGMLEVYYDNLKSEDDKETIKQMVQDETWLNGEKASEYFKNVKVSDELKVIACSDFDFSCYNNIPDSLLKFIKNQSNNKESDYEKEIENKKEIELLKAKLALELA